MRSAGRIAELIASVLVHKPAQTQDFAEPLPPIELQRGRTRGEEQPPQLAAAEELAELRHRHIDEEQD